MADISQFPNHEQHFLPINTLVFSQAVKDIARQMFFNSSRYQILQDKARMVNLSATELDSLFRSALPQLQVQLANLNLSGYTQPIAEINQALAAGGLDVDTQQQLEAEQQRLLLSMQQTLRAAGKTLADFVTTADRRIQDIRDVVILQRTEGPLADEQQHLQQLQQQLQTKQALLKEISRDRSKLIACQDLLRQKNIMDTFKDYLPDPADLKSLDLAAPELELIKQSLALVQKMLGQLSAGVKYVQLAEARKTLDQQYDQVNHSINELTSELAASAQVLADLNAVVKVEQARQQLAAQASVFSQSCHYMLDQLHAALQPAQPSVGLNLLVQQFSDYLQQTSDSFRRNILS